MHSRLLHQALSDFASQVAKTLQAELDAGAEIPFELGDGGGRRGRATLQLYSPQPGAFLAQHWALVARLPGHRAALDALNAFRGLDRYLACSEFAAGQRTPVRSTLASRALKAFADDVFREQGDFVLRKPRLEAALARLDAAAAAQSGSVTLLASLHGLAMLSPQIQLAERLMLALPQTLSGIPEHVLVPALWQEETEWQSKQAADQLLVVLELDDQEGRFDRALAEGKQMLRELLRTLRLYGDGRIALGPLAWACVGDGPFTPLALGVAGRPQGVLVVHSEQEDELRAFCSLLARRTPRHGPIAWALRRFEQGCERADELDGLSDHLLALNALLEPERTAPGLLASRIATLCAPAEARKQTVARVLRAIALERDQARGEAHRNAAAIELAREIAGHLRALLSDAICGHLRPDLIAHADELALTGEQSESDEPTQRTPAKTLQPQPEPSEEQTVRVRRTRRPMLVEQAQDALPI